MVLIFLVVASFFVGFAAFGALYQFTLAIVFLLFCKKKVYIHSPQHSFLILIPAHNESTGIGQVLESCKVIEYPPNLFSIVVIADNCSDDTAEIVRQHGVKCMERHDTEKRGKGEALAWAIPQLLETQQDAIMIVDADCFLDKQVLFACDEQLTKGAKAIQVSYLVSNPDDSFRCYCMALARIIENRLYYWPKSVVGLAPFLIGSGMVLHRQVLEKHPWQCMGLNEDFEYCFHLIENGIKPVFAGGIGLTSPFPVDEEQLVVQRTRWVFGGIEALKHAVGRLLYKGFCSRNWWMFEAGVAMFYISRPVIMAQVGLAGLLSLGAWGITSSHWSCYLVAIWLGTVFLYLLYLLFGVILLGVNIRRMKYLAMLPLFMIKYLEIAVKSFIRPPKDWVRTPREPKKD